jgi:hypothetical protein
MKSATKTFSPPAIAEINKMKIIQQPFGKVFIVRITKILPLSERTRFGIPYFETPFKKEDRLDSAVLSPPASK